MKDKVREFHHQRISAALELFFRTGDVDPQVNYLKDGELYSLITRPGAGVNQATLMREVVDSRKRDLVNFVTIAEKDEEGLVRKSRPRNVESSGKEKEFLIATTSLWERV